MKTMLLFTIICVLGCQSHQHNSNFDYEIFTGSIEYQYQYESTTIKKLDSLRKIKPSKSIFRFDTNNYQSKFIGKDTFTYFYSGKFNKCISETNNNKIYEC